MENDKVYFSYQQVRSNFFKTYLLVIIMALLAFAVAALIGYLMNDLRMGLLIGAVVALVVIPLEILTAKIAIKIMTRGRDLDMDNQKERDLYRIVEGLAIAAGLKRTPEVFIVPSDVPNAFASGMSEKDAFIGVTRGLLNTLNRSELEGVIAHEISHIVHRDIMVSQLVVGLVSVILILVFIAERVAMVRSMGERRRSNDNDNNSAAAVALVAMLIFILLRPLAYLIASLLQLAVSRKREYAADAYAVRLCNNNEGLARALEKIGGVGQYSQEEVEELGGTQLKAAYISFPGEGLFSTHPPIEERIKIIRSMY